VRIEVILRDRGYETKTCFESIAEKKDVSEDEGEGKTVLEQKKDCEE
jgi:hypothetical protein